MKITIDIPDEAFSLIGQGLAGVINSCTAAEPAECPAEEPKPKPAKKPAAKKTSPKKTTKKAPAKAEVNAEVLRDLLIEKAGPEGPGLEKVYDTVWSFLGQKTSADFPNPDDDTRDEGIGSDQKWTRVDQLDPSQYADVAALLEAI